MSEKQTRIVEGNIYHINRNNDETIYSLIIALANGGSQTVFINQVLPLLENLEIGKTVQISINNFQQATIINFLAGETEAA